MLSALLAQVLIFDFWPLHGDFQILRVNVDGQNGLQIQKFFFSLFLYIGVTLKFTWVLKIQD